MEGSRILIIADIEGSSGCLNRNCAKFMGKGWPRACRAMTRDVDAVVTALFDSGAADIHIQDFHRTGYNLMPAGLHPRASLAQGYRRGPIPGIGKIRGIKEFHGLIMLGMHAPSGSTGFIPHTLTSRITKITINGALVSEAQLFSAALAPIPPLFFSGCPAACAHTRQAMPGVHCFPMDRAAPDFSPETWRYRMAEAAVNAVTNAENGPYNPTGNFQAQLTMVRKTEAKAMARRWKVRLKGHTLELEVLDFSTLFRELSRLAYLSPLKARLLPLGLPFYHLVGKTALALAEKKAPVSQKKRGTGDRNNRGQRANSLGILSK